MSEPICIEYTFSFTDNTKQSFRIDLDKSTSYITTSKLKPDWAKLLNDQCPNCPLDLEKHEFCPVALNMSDLTDFFKDVFSYTEAKIEIKTRDRSYFKETSVQDGLSAMYGIVMVTSGCPILDKLRPMVKTHLPFSTTRESLYRALSMYLTAQFLRKKKGLHANLSIDGLLDIYSEISIVDRAFCNRMANHFDRDANINAVVILNSFAEFTTLSIKEDYLEELESLFSAYFKEE